MSRIRGGLREIEEWWVAHQVWLEQCGYMLRPRYHPVWVPSWTGEEYVPFEAEDSIPSKREELMDATRISDGTFVMLKRIDTSNVCSELEITQMFSVENLSSDPQNHSVHLHEVLRPLSNPKFAILVIPLLLPYNFVGWDTFGEVIHFIRQIFEGLLFIHKHNVAHRDCHGQNVMMDAPRIYDEPWHPQEPFYRRDFTGFVTKFTRTQRPPVRYVFIDFGVSYHHNPLDGPPLVKGIRSADYTAPEYVAGATAPLEWPGLATPHDPFPTDVYYLGNLLRREFTEGFEPHGIKAKQGFGFLKPLIADMVQGDPSKRPNMDEVVKRFDDIMSGLSQWKLRSRIVEVDESWMMAVWHGVRHWRRRLYFIRKHIPPIPQ